MIGYRSGCSFCLVVKNDRLVYKFDRIVIDLVCFIHSLSKKILRLYKGLLTFATRSFLMEIALVLSVSVFELWKWKRPFLYLFD